MKNQLNQSLIACIFSVSLTACVSTNPSLGGSSGNTITGAAGGAQSQGENKALERCEAPLGTLSIYEDTNENWWYDYRRMYPKLGTTVPLIRVMIQQSNCFVIVERGKAMQALQTERALMESGELRQQSNFGKGQLVAADYTVSPSIQFSESGTQNVGGLLGGWVGVVAGGLSSNEAATTLLLVDNRSGVQVSAAAGNAKNWDFSAFGGVFSGLLAGVGGYTDTPEGKVISAAFMDSYNNMVKALKSYRAQDIAGGLGRGGALGVND
ncbi:MULTISPECIES: CsgG/HfaB family protein [unclassified Idiomarina]|uniref:CsgG/HfaB family protein n=1 Tax=unclassified Idiomarina TaxID=2614829 RepID=UPI000C9256C2|nr:CsgG/HfaB family protein [Idiomarina sp. UBA3162]MAD54116.1 peptidoglycan-binding protein [Idiomarinaceae bacterium]MEC7642189.1 CsgG/HfaB family protein [Pseudomonadota bacterium]|tara:strand:- start:1186 stop:1986 length:801 start_codon:yes stop_codon:yes gene_type:complete